MHGPAIELERINIGEIFRREIRDLNLHGPEMRISQFKLFLLNFPTILQVRVDSLLLLELRDNTKKMVEYKIPEAEDCFYLKLVPYLTQKILVELRMCCPEALRVSSMRMPCSSYIDEGKSVAPVHALKLLRLV